MTAPPIDQLARLLDSYFVGPIERTKLEAIHRDLEKLDRDDALRLGDENAMRANRKRYFGQLWHEQLKDVADPLAVYVAASRGGQLVPRLYCPAELVGSWIQAVPAAARWRLSAEGAVEIDDPPLKASARWCVHLTNEDGDGLDGNELWLYRGETSDYEAFYIDSVTSNDVALTWITLRSGDIPYKLRRS